MARRNLLIERGRRQQLTDAESREIDRLAVSIDTLESMK